MCVIVCVCEREHVYECVFVRVRLPEYRNIEKREKKKECDWETGTKSRVAKAEI